MQTSSARDRSGIMTRDYTAFIHRVNTKTEENFDAITDEWSDLNPDWHVVTWNADLLDAEFTDLRTAVHALAGQPKKIEAIYAIALIEHWGGIFVPSDDEPCGPIQAFRQHQWKAGDKIYFGADSPGRPEWREMLAKCIKDNDVDVSLLRPMLRDTDPELENKK